MVNTGRPSRGCRTCKRRHQKCDERRPGCRRCEISGYSCPGYNHVGATIFRDETKITKERADQAVAAHASAFAWRLDPPPAGVPKAAVGVQQHDASLGIRELDSCWEDSLTEYMLSAFSHLPTSRYIPGWECLVVPTYLHSPSSSSAVRDACRALALGWFGRILGRPELAAPMRKAYGKALSSIQKAVEDTVQSKTDETLLSILILAGVEAISCSNPRGSAYRQHLEGAIKLVQLRGLEQLQLPESRRLFHAVRQCMLTQRLAASHKLDSGPNFDWFPAEELQYLQGSDSSADPVVVRVFDLTVLSKQVADLRYLCKQAFSPPHDIPSDETISSLLLQAALLQQGLSRWHSSLPSEMQRHVSVQVPVDRDPGSGEKLTWNSTVHSYSNHPHACLMGHFYTMRIYVQAVVLRCRCWQMFPYGGVDDRVLATLTEFQPLQDTVDNICYIVPSTLTGTTPAGRETARTRRPHDLAEAMLPATIPFLTPLLTAYSVEGIDETQRRWMKGRLIALGQSSGLGICDVLVKSTQQIVFQGDSPFRTSV